MDKRLYAIDEETFKEWILSVIEGSYIWKGRPPIISHYKVFCAIIYVLRIGIPWRDLPKSFGNWHSIYMRFQRGNEKALWWKILMNLQKEKKVKMNIVICDSSSFKYHRHGGGQKGGNSLKEEVSGCYIIEDKGYDSNSHREYLRSNSNIPVIPGRRNRIEVIEYDKDKFKLRRKIENFFAMLKENRRLALRFEKSDLAFLSFIALATIKYNLC